jgi:hypothetical protein
MRSKVWLSLSLVIALAGCGEGGSSPPPLDEMPLRDGLRAEPEVVAALSEPSRARLAARLATAAAGDASNDQLDEGAAGPAALVGALDRARESRGAEPLVVGAITGGLARPLAGEGPAGDAALPVMEGAPAGTTATMEARALRGAAAAPLRALLAAAGAHHLVRVVGWPVGAVAIGDAVYVNASWLVAAAPGDDGGVDAEAAAPEGWGAAASGGGAATAAASPDAGQPGSGEAASPVETRRSALGYDPPPDGGVMEPSSTTSPSFWDACASCSDACASTDTSDDSCDSGDSSGDACASSGDGSDGTGSSSSDSCSGTSSDGTDSSSDACSTNPDDGSSSGCQIAPGRGRARGPRRLPWLLAPLIFLFFRRHDR